MSDVFLSYATEDQNTANAILRLLESHNISCWIATRDIPAGLPYAEAIVQGVQGAQLIIVLLTSFSRSSEHVRRETECAVGAQRPILTLQMPGAVPDQALAYYLATTQWVRNDGHEVDESQLLAAVTRIRTRSREAASIRRGAWAWLSNLFKDAVSGPVFVVSALLLLISVPTMSAYGGGEFEQGNLLAAQTRLAILVSLVLAMGVGFAVERAITSRRGPSHPLKPHFIPSYVFASALFFVAGIALWRAINFLPVSTLWPRWQEWRYVIDFGPFYFSLDNHPHWPMIEHALSIGEQYSWDLGWAPLLNLLPPAIILGGVALVCHGLTRSVAWRPLVTVVVAGLPFIVVLTAFPNGRAPSSKYWIVAAVTSGLSLGLAAFWKKCVSLLPPSRRAVERTDAAGSKVPT